MKSHKIALVSIARNESRCIARMLTSAAPWVDEMIVVDTGSDDDTIKIAEKCGAKVSRFEWCNDFSAARNHALTMTKMTWRLILDADEYLVENSDVLRALRSEKPDFMGLITVKSSFPVNLGNGKIGSLDSLDQLPRVLPRGVLYTGSVHEQPAMPGADFVDTRIIAAHDGYELNQSLKKTGRNKKILERELERVPDDPYFNFHYARELHKDGNASRALDFYLKALSVVKNEDRVWRRISVISALMAAGAAKRFSEGFAIAEEYSPVYHGWPDFWFKYSDFLLGVVSEHPELADGIFPQIEAALTTCLEIGETPQISGSVPGRGSFLAESNLRALKKRTHSGIINY